MKRFKDYSQDQPLLLPPSFDDLIPANDLVRVVNSFINEIDNDLLMSAFIGGGRPAFHPKMVIKVLVYAYSRKIYSCRNISRSLKSDIHFMWLSGMQFPDFRTINRFRGEYFKEILDKVFAQLVMLLLEKDYIKSKDYFLDGTTIEADANKYSYVWRKNTEKFKSQVQERALEIIKCADRINEKEDLDYSGKDLYETGCHSNLTSEDIRNAASELNGKAEKVSSKKEARSLKSTAKKLEKEASKLAKYETQEKSLSGRNSYSKTDPDATFLRMKNNELKPGYNVQAGTENGYVCGFSVHQNANDGITYPSHMAQREKVGLPPPQNIIADAGYGNEENYDLIEKAGMGNYMKFPSYYRESKNNNEWFTIKDFKHNQENDYFLCKQGRKLHFVEERVTRNSNDYERRSRNYESSDCSNCPLKSKCTKAELRTLQFSPTLNKHKTKVKENLQSEEGIDFRKRRGNEVETVFGHLKHNMNYKRIRLRSLKKAVVEMAIMFMSHNLIKISKAI